SIDIMIYVFFETPDWAAELKARHRLALDIMRLAQDLEVEFAYPTQTLLMQRPGELPELQEPAAFGGRVDAVHERARQKAAAISQGSDGRTGIRARAASEEN
ncbi:MAG: hypothetical protein AAF725_08475, partial [Acidobacteriota bacterium]